MDEQRKNANEAFINIWNETKNEKETPPIEPHLTTF